MSGEGRRQSTGTESVYFAGVIADSESPSLMAAIYQVATGRSLPVCRWWARRHRWQSNGSRGSVHTGEAAGRSVVCRRCGTGFSVGSLGWQTWNFHTPDVRSD